MFSVLYVLSQLVRPLKMLAVVGSLLGGLALVGLYTFQKSLIYPASLNDGRGYCATPDALDMPHYEQLFLDTPDGVKIQCYVLKHDPNSTSYSNKTVLILPPNAGNIGHGLHTVAIFYKDFGYNVVILSYRGYGKSTGTPLESGIKIDAQTVLKHITETDEQLLLSSLVLYGRSLGGAVAIYIASLYSSKVLGIILENTFLSIPKTVPHIFPALKYFTGLVTEKWNTESLIPTIPSSIPLLCFSARSDEIVPPSHMDRIFDLVSSDEKSMYKYKNSSHNDTDIQPHYWERVQEFIREKVNPVGY